LKKGKVIPPKTTEIHRGPQACAAIRFCGVSTAPSEGDKQPLTDGEGDFRRFRGRAATRASKWAARTRTAVP